MCCFSNPIESVTGTHIFARSLPEGGQVLVYSMTLSTPVDVAMILPIPVRTGTAEKDVTFVDLSGYKRFFDYMAEAFEKREPAGDPFASAGDAPALKVQMVGAYEASFVPTVADFARLDARFRLPAGTWEKLPQYKNYGFAVFKLRKGNSAVHPMAFSFPRANAAQLYFPTVHIHDGQVHDMEEFDHALYCQRLPDEKFSLMEWEESSALPHHSMDVVKARGIVHPQHHLYRREYKGKRKNEDIVLS